MKNFKKWIAVGVIGAAIGVSVSMLAASPATAVAYARCDSTYTLAEAQLAKDYNRGKIDQATYEKMMGRIAEHRALQGC